VPDVFDLSCRAVVLPIVPMFHAAAWGLPFAAPIAGPKIVFTADYTRKRVRHHPMTKASPTRCGPTVWLG
jgi:fatty-acyl-CoA synthase